MYDSLINYFVNIECRPIYIIYAIAAITSIREIGFFFSLTNGVTGEGSVSIQIKNIFSLNFEKRISFIDNEFGFLRMFSSIVFYNVYLFLIQCNALN